MNKFEVGSSVSIEKSFTEEDVRRFSELSEDKNPIHLDSDFATNSIFKQKIVHGFLYSSLISALLGNKLPGPGSIYLHQELNFKKPVFIEDKIKATVTITDFIEEKGLVFLDTFCYKNDLIVLEGKAIMKIY